MLVTRGYNEALHLHEQRFKTRVCSAWQIANRYELIIETKTSLFRYTVKHINERLINYWKTSIADVAMNPILHTYIYSDLILNAKLNSKLLKMVVTDRH